MESEEFTSLSKGCFAVKPAKRRDKYEVPFIYQEEGRDSSESRYEWYSYLKNLLDITIDSVLDEINATTVSTIVDFIVKSYENKQLLEIHTLTIKVGVNALEYNSVYEKSFAVLKSNLDLADVTLKPQQRNDITAILKDIFNQTLNVDNDFEKTLMKTLSLKDLFCYLSNHNKCKGLIICIPRFELFQSSIIGALVNLCVSSKNVSFPVFFVFGLATGTELTSDWISISVMAQLKVEMLTLPSPTLLLEKCLMKCLLCPKIPFKLSYRTFEVLLSRFSLSNYSIHDVMKTVKIALLNHSCQQPLVKLLTKSPDQLEYGKLYDEEKALILQLPSVQEHIEKVVVCNKPLALLLLNGDENAIKILFQNCYSNYKILYYSFKMVHCLVRNIPGNSLVGKPLELYSFFIQGNVVDVKEVTIALRCFGMMQIENFLSRLTTACEEFQTFDNPPERVSLLNRVLQMQIDEVNQVLNETEVPEIETDEVSVTPNQKKRAIMDNIKQRHLAKNEKLEALKKSFVSRMENYLSTLTAPTAWPLHELTWYSNHSELQNLLVGKCRTALHRGLLKPNLYLQCSDGLSKPDMCHLYELYHEHGRLICLHDWLKSYNYSLGKGKQITDETHARFVRAVSELHFMGYLKPTKRKTDHVAKLSLLGY